MPLILILLLAVFQCSHLPIILIANPDYYQLGAVFLGRAMIFRGHESGRCGGRGLTNLESGHGLPP